MLMPDSNYKNLASAVLENAGTTSDTSITMASTYAANFPDVPFFATIMPTTDLPSGSNSEIVKVTASSTSGSNTTFTITRAQRGTSAISWSAGQAVLSHSVYVEDVESQRIGVYIANYTSTPATPVTFVINNASAPTNPAAYDRIRVVFDATYATIQDYYLKINGGTSYPIIGNTVTTNTTYWIASGNDTRIKIQSEFVYDLVFTGAPWNCWVAENVSAPVRTEDLGDQSVTAAKIGFSSFYNNSSDISGSILNPKSGGDSLGNCYIGGAGLYQITATATISYSGNGSEDIVGITVIATNGSSTQIKSRDATATQKTSGTVRLNVSTTFTAQVTSSWGRATAYAVTSSGSIVVSSGDISVIRVG